MIRTDVLQQRMLKWRALTLICFCLPQKCTKFLCFQVTLKLWTAI